MVKAKAAIQIENEAGVAQARSCFADQTSSNRHRAVYKLTFHADHESAHPESKDYCTEIDASLHEDPTNLQGALLTKLSKDHETDVSDRNVLYSALQIASLRSLITRAQGLARHQMELATVENTTKVIFPGANDIPQWNVNKEMIEKLTEALDDWRAQECLAHHNKEDPLELVRARQMAKLIRDGRLQKLLEAEMFMVRALAEKRTAQSEALQNLRDEQRKELVGWKKGTEVLAARQREDMEILQAVWKSEILDLKTTQVRDYWSLVNTLVQSMESTDEQDTAKPDSEAPKAVAAEIERATIAPEVPSASTVPDTVISATVSSESQQPANVAQSTAAQLRSRFKRFLDRNKTDDQQDSGNIDVPTDDDAKPVDPITKRLIQARESVGKQRFVKITLAGTDRVSRGPKFEESFTVHFGQQLKVAQNLRLLAVSPLYFTTPMHMDVLNPQSPPERLQSLLALYSGGQVALSGLVLIVNTDLQFHSPYYAEFLRASDANPELHFPTATRQIEDLRRYLTQEDGTVRELQAGDVYITKHSNLAHTQIVFHLVLSEEDLVSQTLSPKSPSLTGLAHIMRLAAQYEVQNLALPLLLSYEYGGVSQQSLRSKRRLQHALDKQQSEKQLIDQARETASSNITPSDTHPSTDANTPEPTMDAAMPRDGRTSPDMRSPSPDTGKGKPQESGKPPNTAVPQGAVNPDQWAARRVDTILKALKGFIMERQTSSAGKENISTIQLLLPPEIKGKKFAQIADTVSSTFRMATPLNLSR
eukprot:Clim_evm6s87 gene=Clim_evmTU6s87